MKNPEEIISKFTFFGPLVEKSEFFLATKEKNIDEAKKQWINRDNWIYFEPFNGWPIKT